MNAFRHSTGGRDSAESNLLKAASAPVPMFDPQRPGDHPPGSWPDVVLLQTLLLFLAVFVSE